MSYVSIDNILVLSAIYLGDVGQCLAIQHANLCLGLHVRSKDDVASDVVFTHCIRCCPVGIADGMSDARVCTCR